MYWIKYRSTSNYSNTEQIYKIYKYNNNEYGDKNGKPSATFCTILYLIYMNGI